ncbi:hypothetical protein BN946_scf184675.g6 [Trametes cinnabarina]|uniref:Uncharacterized protein n=1 Tax=Pycnoporus cinnabarinus TaxID=5643 RepID=A0A060SY53_PYCCI|nr:hypothetical protein BN946_scf184675.g6 [Trametes cinnabarina]
MIPSANNQSTSEEVTGMAGHPAEMTSGLGSPPPIAPIIFTPTTNGGGDYISRSRLKPVSGKFEMIPPEDEHFMAERVDRPLAFMACKLDAILFKPWKVRPNKEGYWPDYEDLEELQNLLEARRYTAEGDFRQARKAPPSIPFWGRNLTANGREVEYFLARLSELHQFNEEPFWDNGPSFLGHFNEPITSENPRQTRKERHAARKNAMVTPTSSPFPLPSAPRKPNRDLPPHLHYPHTVEEDLTISHYGQVRHSCEPIDEAGASNS